LGLPDVYAADFARGVDQAASTQCTERKYDPLVIGYFLGNEPPWGDRESEVVDMILAGSATATKTKLKEFLAGGDTTKRRKQFVVDAFKHYLELVCAAVRKYDPNHLILGIRYGGRPADEVLRAARIFDVCSINVYEYEPTRQLERAYRLAGRPLLMAVNVSATQLARQSFVERLRRESCLRDCGKGLHHLRHRLSQVP
jgi:hypothetical protein